MLVMTTMQWRKRHLSKGGSEKEVGGENLGFCRIVHTQKLPGGSLLIRAPGTILQHSGERQIVRFDSSLLSSFKDNLWCSPLCRFYPVVLQIIVQGVDRVATDNEIFRRSSKNDKTFEYFTIWKRTNEAPVCAGSFSLFDHQVPLSALLDFSSVEVTVRASWIMWAAFEFYFDLIKFSIWRGSSLKFLVTAKKRNQNSDVLK